MEFFKNLWSAIRFGVSATLGVSLATTIVALFGSAYLLAESTNIVEAKVRHNIFGGKEVGFNPFFKSISDGIRNVMVDAWTDYCAYAPIQASKIVFEKTGREVDFTKLKETQAKAIASSTLASSALITEAATLKDNKEITTPTTNNIKITTPEVPVLNPDALKSNPSTVIAQPVKAESFLSEDKTIGKVEAESITKSRDSGVRSS
jgi:hypothetical protein